MTVHNTASADDTEKQGVPCRLGDDLSGWMPVRTLMLCLAMQWLIGTGVAAAATEPIQAWRAELTSTRLLAENNAAKAHEQAQVLHQNLPSSATLADRAQALNLLSRTELYLARFELSDMHAYQALALAKQHDDRVGQVEAYLNLAASAVNQAKINEHFQLAIPVLEAVNGLERPDLFGETMLRVAMMYRRAGRIDESLTMCIQAMEIAKRSNDPWALAYAHQGLGISYDQSGKKSDALVHYREMRKQAQLAGSRLLEAYALTGISGIIRDLGDVPAGEATVREAISMFREVGQPSGLAHSLFHLASMKSNQGRYAESMKILDEVVGIFERHPHDLGLWFVFNARSDNYQHLGMPKEAFSEAERAYAVARKIDFPYYIGQSAKRMAAMAADAGDHAQAYRYLQESLEMRDRLDVENSAQRIVELTERYKVESKQREIDALKKSNELQAATLKQNALRQRLLWTVLGGSLLLLGGGAFFSWRLKRSHRLLASAHAQLQQSQAAVSALNASLEQTVQSRTAELRQQTRYLRTLIDMLPLLTWFKDTQSRFVVVNKTMADSVGEQVEAMAGMMDQDYWPEMAESYRKDDLEVMSTHEGKTIQERYIVPGKETWIETYKAAVVDEDGTVLGTVGCARDISVQKETEAAREAALAEAERLARMRSQFLAQMSHELRTPLNGILGYAQILLRHNNLDQKQIEGISVIQHSGEHLLMLINDILEFAKIEAGRMELNIGDVAMEKLLQTIAGIIRVKADQKHLEFIVETPPNLPLWIRTDEKRLRQVLLNLLANAVKFTDHGQVALRIDMSSGGRLRFAVSDTGIGIAPDQVERIFEPFEQAGENYRRAGGTGLGLAISRQLVRLMGGDIEVRSVPGEGSIFSFELETQSVDQALAIEPAGSRITGYAGANITLMVVDDVAENRAVLVDMLSPLGFDIIEAENGREALDKAVAQLPSLILMDIRMPEMDGLEATHRLRQLTPLNVVPIIAISASTSGNDEQTCVAAGVDVFLPKPVDFDRLLAHIARLLKLEWVYEPQVVEAAWLPDAPLVIPPLQDMEELHRLARQGNMRDIAHMGHRLIDQDPSYRPFAAQLLMLTKGYRSRAILNFVERYLKGK